MSGMELKVKSDELGSLGTKSKYFMCATKEGAAATCTSDCACVDDKHASLQRRMVNKVPLVILRY